MDALAAVRQRFAALEQVLDEKSRRLVVAAESKALGSGGISAVSRAREYDKVITKQDKARLARPTIT